MSDAAMLVLLGWIERGLATMEAAKHRGRLDKPSWAMALRLGYFTIERSGGLKLTPAGKEWMANLRMLG
jgi:hypothetical protein